MTTSKIPAAEKGIAETLADFRLFEGVEASRIKPLEQIFQRLTFKSGENLTRFDATDTRVFFIIKGSVEVRIPHEGSTTEESLYQVGANDTVGEFLIARVARRTASCVAFWETEALMVDGPVLLTHLQANPDLGVQVFLNLSRILCDRLYDSNMLVRRVTSGW